MDEGPTATERRDLATIVLVSFTVMVFQIAVTRVLSVVVWYHFAFLTISMVMLGLGAPGVWFALMSRPQRWLPVSLLLGGLAVPGAAVALLRFGADSLRETTAYLIVFVMPATLSLGAAVCLLLMRAEGLRVARMYGYDLLGACLGALVVIPLLHVVPTPHLVAGLGLLPLGALALYPGPLRIVALAAALAVTALMVDGTLLEVVRSKKYREDLVKPIYEKWSPTARITIFDESFFFLREHESGFSWGRGEKDPTDKLVLQYWLEQDGSAGTPITFFDGNLSSLTHLDYDVTTFAYQLRPPRSAAIIGGGGGRDILSAMRAGADEIEVVELNPYIVEAVSEHLGHFSGDPYHAPGVRAVTAEGRSHLTHTQRQFDLIQISLIDSWAASAAGAFALAENNLYTVEAFELYASRLSASGLLSTSRWMSELPRLIVLARAALDEMGVDEPEQHLALAAAGSVGSLLLSIEPFSQSEIARMGEICVERGFECLYPLRPGERTRRRHLVHMLEGDYSRMTELGLNVRPPRDDSPYFFHTLSPFADPSKLDRKALRLAGMSFNQQSSRVLRQTMVGVGVLTAVLFFLPFVHRVGRGGASRASLLALGRGSVYFAAIGAGFMLLENTLLQRFVLYLGHPSYAATVILASLLFGMGLGSTFAARIGVARLQRLGLAIVALLSIILLSLPPLMTTTLGLDLAARVAVTFVILAPVGGALGLFLPLGMVRFGDVDKPWFWAINGAFGVVAGVLSLALAMDFGFALVGQLSAVLYVLAWLCLRGETVPATRTPAP